MGRQRTRARRGRARLVTFWREISDRSMAVEEAQLELPPSTQVAGSRPGHDHQPGPVSRCPLRHRRGPDPGQRENGEVGRTSWPSPCTAAALSIQRAMITDSLIARLPGSTGHPDDEDNRALTVAAAVP